MITRAVRRFDIESLTSDSSSYCESVSPRCGWMHQAYPSHNHIACLQSNHPLEAHRSFHMLLVSGHSLYKLWFSNSPWTLTSNAYRSLCIHWLPALPWRTRKKLLLQSWEHWIFSLWTRKWVNKKLPKWFSSFIIRRKGTWVKCATLHHMVAAISPAKNWVEE